MWRRIDSAVRGLIRVRRCSMLLGVVALVLATSAVSCDEDPREISYTFVNETGRHITYIAVRAGQTFETESDRRGRLGSTRAPGEVFSTAAPAGVAHEDGEPWCPDPLISYYFISPKDPTVTSPNSPMSAQPLFDLNELDIVHVLDAPCWPKQSGNRNDVTADE